MKSIVIGVGAFGFAVLHHISAHHLDQTFFAYEKENEVFQYLQKHNQHPYFFPGVSLGSNISWVQDISTLGEYDLIILAIPAQYIAGFLLEIQPYLRPGVIFLNLSKGIDSTTLQTASTIFASTLKNRDYRYAVLSGGMIASELVEQKMLGAHIASDDIQTALQLQELFQTLTLRIDCSTQVKNVELFGSIKNIFALYVGYLEAQGNGYSTIGFFLCELLKELPKILERLGGSPMVDFSDFALGGDMIATCFGNSRNRYFGKLVGEGMTPLDAQKRLQQEKKHAEGYATLLGFQNFSFEGLPYFHKIYCVFTQ